MKSITNLLNNYQPKKELDKHVRTNSEAQTSTALLWDVMSGMYTDKWIKKNGETPSSTWIAEISLLTDAQIRFGILACRENIRNGDKWAPDFADFMGLVHKQADVDIDGAFDRMIRKQEPLDDIEYNTRADVSYRCKTQLSEDKARKLFKDTYIKYQAKVAQGEFIPDKDQQLIASESQVTELDKMVTERKGKTPIELRMLEIAKRGKL